MRSVPNTWGKIESAMAAKNDRKATKRKKREHNAYAVMGWPNGTPIPSELSDWLAYLLKYRILDRANEELENDEVLTVRFNLGSFQMSRGVTPLFSDYPQYVSILKIDEGKLNIWVDGVLSSMVRNGKAVGKKIFVKNYDRNFYTTSRLLATEKEDIAAALKLFNRRVKNHVLLNYD